ncbi:10583_t:CDS:2 [Entrophospora sp. SA101]|nr:5559_t:CDS:2 [Entrophospora sp. SA101]CAJ0764586.1 10583_t:CDS:2 [Entrophospora sp. SA101]CAJ0927699.1 699_t:CDS:2 [Entrophospora sp. SA101]
MKIKGNTFIVTGGGSGLGLSTAQELLKIGANVVILDINDNNKSIFGDHQDKVLFVKTDIASEKDVKQAISLAINKFGETIRGLVNCGGISPAACRIANKNGMALDLEMFKKVINVNLIGTFNVSRLVASQMIKQKPMEEAIEGQLGQTAYSASKGGVSSMTLPMARDLAKFGIRVAAIAPGIFATPMAKLSSSNKFEDYVVGLMEFPARLGKAEGG